MAVNLSSLGTLLSGIATSIAGLPAATQTAVWNNIGGLMHGSRTRELQICQKMLQFAGNAGAEEQLLNQLINDVSLPPSAAQVALDISKNLTTPGYDFIGRVSQMEVFINAGT